MPAGATYEPIATTTISGSAVTSVTFSSLGSYTDIVAIIGNLTTSTASASLFLRFNSDTGTNYSHTRIEGEGSAASSNRATSQARMQIAFPYQGTSTSIPSFCRAHIFNYGGSTNKTVLAEGSSDQNGVGDVGRYVGLWRSTAAITSITFDLGGGNGIKAGSMFTLYGIKAA